MVDATYYSNQKDTIHSGNGTASLSVYRQNLADKAVSNKVSAVERIQARISLLVSFIPDATMPENELSGFRERISGLFADLNDGSIIPMEAHRRLKGLEDKVYIPIRRTAAAQFDQLHNDNPDMSGDMLLKTLVGDEADEYSVRNPEASRYSTLVALMRASPRADILISMIRQRNDEYQTTVFSWRPLALPLQGV